MLIEILWWSNIAFLDSEAEKIKLVVYHSAPWYVGFDFYMPISINFLSRLCNLTFYVPFCFLDQSSGSSVTEELMI